MQEQPQAPNATPQTGQNPARNAMGIVSLILGILALITSFLPIINNFSALLAFIGAVFGIIGIIITAKNKCGGRGLAIAGLIICIVSIIIVLATQAAFSAAFDEALSSASSSASSSAQTEQAAQAADDAPYAVTIDSCEQTTDYAGNAAIVVSFTWTNNSDSATSFMAAVDAAAFQNGVELDTAVVKDIDGQATLNELKPGATSTVQCAYVLDDTSDVTVECSKLFSLSDEIITERTFALA